jgi:hypothetical protein
MMSKSVTVLIRHLLDDAAQSAVRHLDTLSQEGLCGSYLDVETSSEALETRGDLVCRSVGGGAVSSGGLLDAIARAGSFDVLRIVLIDASSNSVERSKTLNEVAVGIDEMLSQLMGANTKVVRARIALRAFGEELPSEEFFPVTSNANIVVIPQDRISDGAIARPITRGNEVGGGNEFSLHCAIEIASLLGLWSAMHEAPIDHSVPALAGSKAARVLFAQSRVRLMCGPGLPMHRIAPQDEDLPAPQNHFSVADSAFAASQLSNVIYPENLCFSADPEPDFYEYESDLRRLIPAFLREMARTAAGVPRIAIKGIQNELHAIAGEGLQSAIGTDSWVQILWSGRDGDVLRSGVTQVELKDVIGAIESQYRRELLSPLSGDDWTNIVRSLLAGVDGHSDWSRTRQDLFGNERLLLLKRQYICEDEPELTAVMSQLAEQVAIRTRMSELLMPEVTEQVEEVQSAEILVENTEDFTSDESEDDESSEDNAALERLPPPVLPVMEDIAPFVETPAATGVVGTIAERFRNESESAYANVLHTATRLKGLYAELNVRDTSGVSPVFNLMLALALAALFFVSTTCRESIGSLFFDSVKGTARDAVWAGLSASLVAAAILLLGVGGKRSWQVRAAFTSLILSVFVAVLVVFFEDIRDKVAASDGKPWAAVIAGGLTCGLVFVAITRSLVSKNALRRRLGNALAAVTALYLLVGFSSWQARNDSLIGRQSEEFRSRLFWVIAIVSILMILSSLAFVSIVMIRERNRLNSIAKSIEWARNELVTSVDAGKRLQSAAVQWVASAAAIARIVALPLGDVKENAQAELSKSLEGETVLKFDTVKLSLTDRGEATFVASLRKNFVEPGWITRQYEKTVRQYQANLASRTSNKIEAVENKRPECDPEVVVIEELINGTSRTERYQYAKSLYAGEFDSVLVEFPESFDLSMIYQSVLNDENSYRLEGAKESESSITDFLSQVIPTRNGVLPVGLVERTFVAQDPEQQMTTSIWWPTEILGAVPALPSAVTQHDAVARSVSAATEALTLLAIRVDLSETFFYSECKDRLKVGESEKPVVETESFGGVTDL